MRIALISDIHGNAVALDAVLADLARRPADAIVCLGDVRQGGSSPARVAERIRDLACPVVLGNADDFVATGESAEPLTPAHHEVREWTRQQLGEEGLALISTFTPTVELDALLCFHGSPRSFDEVILPDSSDDELDGMFVGVSAPMLAGGHTHMQWCRPIGASLYCNPGSVGLVYDRYADRPGVFHPVAEFAIVWPGRGIEFCRVQLDPEELAHTARASGRPYAEREANAYLRTSD